jgi:hypothetical protein
MTTLDSGVLVEADNADLLLQRTMVYEETRGEDLICVPGSKPPEQRG